MLMDLLPYRGPDVHNSYDDEDAEHYCYCMHINLPPCYHCTDCLNCKEE